MTLFEFGILEERDQIEFLYQHGVYIGKMKEGKWTKTLYQIESFYVEVIYKKYRYHIERLNCFSSTLFLDPYLDQMEVFILFDE